MNKLICVVWFVVVALGCSSASSTADVPDMMPQAENEAPRDLAVDSQEVTLATKDLGSLDSTETLADFSDSMQVDLPETPCESEGNCFLDQCSENSDCQSGWCVEHMGQKVCTQTCHEECPDGWVCSQVTTTRPDLTFVCVSAYPNLCRPCTEADDCAGSAGTEDACVVYGQQGAFCGGHCGDDSQCPWGFHCDAVETVDGIKLNQCISETGQCPCTATSVQLGLYTNCRNDSEFGSCQGKRVCTEQGLTDCDAASPMAEECNGIDDDCDGDVDEPTFEEGESVDICSDENPCTEDHCSGVDGCVNELLDAVDCDDHNACTLADTCVAGACHGEPLLCDDDDPCTDDACHEDGSCQFVANTGNCDDGDPCTVADHCQDGQCLGTSVACDCQADDDCAPLEDEDLCNGTLVCDLEVFPYRCKVDADTVVECPQPDGPDAFCLAAQCGPLTGECQTVPNHSGLSCDDGDACTVNENCQEGVCTGGAPVNCNDGNGCTDDWCDVAIGCVHEPNADACDDGDLCSVGDVCAMGECAAGEQELECDDDNLCTTDSCDADLGCKYESLVCDDQDSCTLDTCLAFTGDCIHTPIAAQCEPCQLSVCNPQTGVAACQEVQCDDQDACTTESCNPVDGKCKYEPLVCTDSNLCTDDSCNPLLGCQNIPNAAVCSDGDVCTTGDVCSQGSCTSGAPINCNDGNLCTDDSCHPQDGCVYVANNQPCDDLNLCTTGDQCANGQCAAGGIVDCDDGNPCTTDACQLAKGCVYEPNDSLCNDGDACTIGDHCLDMQCAFVGILDCDDENECTDDSCDSLAGCLNVPNDAGCDDLDACTLVDQCEDGECVGSNLDDCDDENECTDDSCDSLAGCLNVPNDAGCDDLDACTLVDQCENGECVGSNLDACDDGNQCTDDSCVSPAGCVNLPNDGGCDDGNFCTLTDTCVNGECVGSNEQTCQDDNPCTVDSCSPQGCQYLFQGPCTMQPGPGEGKDHVIGSVYNIDPNGTMDHIRTGGWGDNYWALLQFPLDGLPPTATKATIRLFGMNDNKNPTSMYFDRVTSAWAENCTWSQKPSTVNITSIPASQVGVWYEIDVTDLYNGWRAGDYPNHGVQFRSHGTSNNYNGFWSSDYAVDPSLRPMLVVEPVE